MSRRTPKFSTRTPEEDVSRLDPSDSAHASPEETSKLASWRPSLSFRWSREPEWQRSSLPANFFSGLSRWWDGQRNDEGNEESQDGAPSRTIYTPGALRESSLKDRGGHKAHPGEHVHKKLGTYSGVFVPTTLNVLSILMFLRFSFILGQGGVLGILGMIHLMVFGHY